MDVLPAVRQKSVIETTLWSQGNGIGGEIPWYKEVAGMFVESLC